MANSFLNLPMPGGNGAGANVNTSAQGAEKTIIVGGSFEGATVTVEASVDGGTVFQPVATFHKPGKKVVPVAAQFMRVFVRGRTNLPFSANADVGANGGGGSFGVALVAPANDGVGTPVDVSALGDFTSFVVGGSFAGATVAVEASEDGTSYQECASFHGQGGILSKNLIANWMRVRVKGHDGNANPFTPTIGVGSANFTEGAPVSNPLILSTGDVAASAPNATYPSLVLAGGSANGGTAEVYSQYGVLAAGSVFAADAAATARIRAGSWVGNMAFGYVYAQVGRTAEIISDGAGALSFGSCYAGAGSLGSRIYNNVSGGFAGGSCYSGGGNAAAIEALDQGSFAFGMAENGDIRVGILAEGSWAGGKADQGGDIEALDEGSFAFGKTNGFDIRVNGEGSGAFGRAFGGDIEALAHNCFQFGEGTNSEADTFSVGTGPRLKATNGPPSSPRNGDMWVNGANVYIRSGGVNVLIS